MKKFIIGIAGWLTFPGFMFTFLNQKWDEPIRPMESRQSAWIAFVLLVIATTLYGGAAVYFGSPMFRGSAVEILSPLAGLIWVFNFFSMVMCGIALATGKFNNPSPG